MRRRRKRYMKRGEGYYVYEYILYGYVLILLYQLLGYYVYVKYIFLFWVGLGILYCTRLKGLIVSKAFGGYFDLFSWLGLVEWNYFYPWFVEASFLGIFDSSLDILSVYGLVSYFEPR